MTPEQVLIKTIHELCLNYLAQGGNTAFLIGMGKQLEIFWEAPDRLNAQRQSEAMLMARSQTPKEEPDAPPARQ